MLSVADFVFPSIVTDSVAKALEANANCIIVTHNARFHCDDVLAVGLLLALPEHRHAAVVRTRNEQDIEKGDVVVDVGGIYDPARLRFDHHQKGFNETYSSTRTVTKMSSVGMVYKHFGRRLLLEVFKFPESVVDIVQERIYESLIESIDAIDNGVDITPPGVEPRYMICTDLSSRVARLNPDWLKWDGVDYVTADAFVSGIKMAMEEFSGLALSLRDSWLPGREIVQRALESRFDTHPSGSVIELECGCPYETHLENLEQEMATGANKDQESQCNAERVDVTPPHILFVIYPNTPDKKSWRIKAVRQHKNTFENRLSLPERFRGLRDGAIGLADVNFVHHAGFLAGTNTQKAALALADLAIEEHRNQNDAESLKLDRTS